MAITTNNNYKLPKKNMPVIKMSRGGEVSSMDYSERMEYIKNEILPKVSNTIKTFNIYSSGFSYDMNQDYKKTYEEILNNYKSISDYDENSLDENTIYRVDGWEILRKEIDPDTNDVIDTQELEMVESGNTYNHSYLGLVDVNFRIYQDEEYGKYILIMHTHIGGDIRGNYDNALILIGDDKDELLYKFYEEFLNGVCTLILNFKDGSSLTFDSTQDSDIFNFEYIDEDELEEGSTAHHVLQDFESLSGYDADEFIENINNEFHKSSNKMASGGEINDRPKAYIQILGYPEGKWLDLTEFSNGSEVIYYITQWMNNLNEKTGGNREEYEVADYEGFGNILFSQYMGETDFDEILEAYKEFENTDFPNEVVEQYFKDLGFKELTDVIGSMESNYYGRFDSYSDFAYEMVENESYVASERDMFVTDTDKRIIAGEEADNFTDYMDFEELLENAPNTKEKYEEEKDVLEYALDNANEDEHDKIIEEIENLEEKYQSLAYEEVHDNHYEYVYNKLENDLQGYLEEMGMNPNDASFVRIDYDAVADELMNDFHVIENNGDYYFFYVYNNGGKVSYINKPSKNNTHYVVELSLGKIVSGWENRDSAEEDRKSLVLKYPKHKFGIYKKDKLKEKYNLDTETYNDYVDLSKNIEEKKVSIKKQADKKEVNKEIEELNEKINSKLKELTGRSSKDEDKIEKLFQEIKELTKKKDRLALSHFHSTGYMYARGGRTRKLKKYFKKAKTGVNKALDYSREKYYQASDYAEKKDLKGKIKRGATKVWDKTKQGASWFKRQWEEADFGDGKGKAKFFNDGGGVSKFKVGDRIVDISYSNGSGTIIKDVDGTLFVVQFDNHPTGDYRNISVSDIDKEKHDTMATGGGVDDFKMSYDEMTAYEKSNHIHYNPMNSRWEVTKNGVNKEFWNQEQAEKYAGFEFDNEKDSRYSRKKYEALFGYADGGGVYELPSNLKKRLENANKIIKKYNGRELTEKEAIRFNIDHNSQSGFQAGEEAFNLAGVNTLKNNPTKREYQTIGDALIDISRKMTGVEYDLKENEIQEILQSKGKQFADGGMAHKYEKGGRIDLFEDYTNIPSRVNEVLERYSEDLEDGNYEGMTNALKEIEALGYTFNYYVDGGAYGLRPIGVNLNELEGYEDEEDDDKMARGGHVSKGELVWKKLRDSEKSTFLYENFTPEITPRGQETLIGKSYNFLPKNVKIALESKYANVDEYADGGQSSKKKTI